MKPRKKINLIIFFLLLRSNYVEVTAADQVILDGIDVPQGLPFLFKNGVYYLLENMVETKFIAISDNIVIDGNGYTIQGDLTSDSVGIEITGSTNVTIRNFKISSFENGIHIDESTDNKIYNNTFLDNEYAIVAERDSGYNVLFMNNFIEQEVRISSQNTWYNGFTGNYWSDIDKEDIYYGPYQSEVGSDGIVDRPFYIDEYNIDNYPLMEPLQSINHKSIDEIVGPIISYKLIIVTDGLGTTDPPPGVHVFNENEVVNVTALPENGWEFEQWILDETQVIQNISYTVLMNNPRRILAEFKEIPVEEELVEPNLLIVFGILISIIAIWYFIKMIRMNK
jgi:parallel beta-helix repeat protein